MTLKQTLQKDIITAMKAKDKATANTLRMVDELKSIIIKTIDETGLRNAGPLTGKVMAQVKGQADGSHVRTLILEVLND